MWSIIRTIRAKSAPIVALVLHFRGVLPCMLRDARFVCSRSTAWPIHRSLPATCDALICVAAPCWHSFCGPRWSHTIALVSSWLSLPSVCSVLSVRLFSFWPSVSFVAIVFNALPATLLDPRVLRRVDCQRVEKVKQPSPYCHANIACAHAGT